MTEMAREIVAMLAVLKENMEEGGASQEKKEKIIIFPFPRNSSRRLRRIPMRSVQVHWGRICTPTS